SGSAEWYQVNPEELILSGRTGKREIVDRASGATIAAAPRYTRFKAGHPAGFLEAFANLYVDIADCVSQYKRQGIWQSDEVFGAELALDGLRFMEAMVRSQTTGRWEPVG
ncbi:MAG TPA: gfo/Idh/MocA family oxidoreductase, partial [Candidatus Ozemobacteraceae bacterium]|nr:gfo/Idh/MocA family oxidoreductase [Candidatus Ozemobacteraceae bacterium]